MDPETDSSASDPLDQDDEQGWEDVQEDKETIKFLSLFDERVFSDVKEMLTHCKESYEFDIWKVKRDLGICFQYLHHINSYLTRP